MQAPHHRDFDFDFDGAPRPFEPRARASGSALAMRQSTSVKCQLAKSALKSFHHTCMISILGRIGVRSVFCW